MARATATADELTPDELLVGKKRLERKVKRYEPLVIAVLGIGAYKTAFQEKMATLGLQENHLGKSMLWILPNPSGLNAHYQLSDLVEHFRELREAIQGNV